MFIISKIISDGENNFTQNKYNKLQKISAKIKCFFLQNKFKSANMGTCKSSHITTSTTCKSASSSCKTDLSIHFLPSQNTTIWFFLVTLMLSSSTFYCEAYHRKCEIMHGGWHCYLRLFKLGCLLHTGFKPRSLAWLACSPGQSTATYTTVVTYRLLTAYVLI